MPPGWSPDNKGITAKDCRNDALEELNAESKNDTQELAKMH